MEQEITTIKEIARRLNISPSTVSRALHDHPRIGLRTKMQVKKLAEQLNYQPNQQAIAFKQRKTFTLGLILPRLQEEFFSLAINGIEEVALKNNYSVLIGQSHNDLDLETRIIKAMFEHRIDGLLASISKNTSNIDHFKALNKYNTPVVFFDRVPDVPDIHSVWCNLQDSTVEAVDFLVKQGHRKIALLRGPASLNIKKERLQGYKAAHQKNDMPLTESYIVETDLSSEGTFEAMRQLLSLPERPTAVIAFNDSVALDAILFAKKKNLQINKDISFISYANWPITNYLDSRPIASIEQFPYEQGHMAAKLLLDIMAKENDANTPQHIVMESKLVIYLPE